MLSKVGRFVERVLSDPCRALWALLVSLGEANALFRWIVTLVIGLLLAIITVLSVAPELPR